MSSTQAAPPAKPAPGANGFKYKPRFGLIVPCRDEAHQQQLFELLQQQGFKPKVVCV